MPGFFFWLSSRTFPPSLHADVRALDYVAPALRFCGHEGGGLFGRTEHRGQALLGEALAVVRGRRRFVGIGANRVNPRPRRVGRYAEAEPRSAFELRQADFRARRWTVVRLLRTVQDAAAG